MDDIFCTVDPVKNACSARQVSYHDSGFVIFTALVSIRSAMEQLGDFAPLSDCASAGAGGLFLYGITIMPVAGQIRTHISKLIDKENICGK